MPMYKEIENNTGALTDCAAGATPPDAMTAQCTVEETI